MRNAKKQDGAGVPNEFNKFHSQLPMLSRIPTRPDGKLTCVVAQECGGCPEFARSPEEQRAQKAEELLSFLRADGVITVSEVPWLVGATTGYRNRIRLAMNEGVPGYFNRAKDPACPVLDASVLEGLTAFSQWAKQWRQELTHYRVAEVRKADADGVASVYLRHTQRNGAAQPVPDHSCLPNIFDAGIVAFEGDAPSYQRYELTECVYAQVPVGGFMQVNSSANRLMVQRIVDWVGELRAARVIDLFAGSGNFSLPLAAKQCEVHAVEQDEAACLGMVIAAKQQHLAQVSTIRGDALSTAQAFAGRGELFDVVIADPPRRGLRGNVEAVCRLARRAVVLVSCDGQHFAADAAALVRQGLRLVECVGVDMFPQTRHMEVMGLFAVI